MTVRHSRRGRTFRVGRNGPMDRVIQPGRTVPTNRVVR